jgi:hypothetical protein
MRDHKLRLVCKLKDGRTLSGTYPFLVALARQEHALTWPQCESAVTEEIQ